MFNRLRANFFVLKCNYGQTLLSLHTNIFCGLKIGLFYVVFAIAQHLILSSKVMGIFLRVDLALAKIPLQ